MSKVAKTIKQIPKLQGKYNFFQSHFIRLMVIIKLLKKRFASKYFYTNRVGYIS